LKWVSKKILALAADSTVMIVGVAGAGTSSIGANGWSQVLEPGIKLFPTIDSFSFWLLILEDGMETAFESADVFPVD
jgi:hypothetical protein